MLHEVFLVERATQLRRLRDTALSSLEVPRRLASVRYSPLAASLFRTVHGIWEIPFDGQKQQLLGRLRAKMAAFTGAAAKASDMDGGTILQARHRELVVEFETQVIQLLLSGADGNAIAAEIVNAILQDHKLFFGVKPLAAHSQAFAYEFLFPSWLNLYTVLVLPDRKSGKPRFSNEQVGVIFAFLQEYEVQQGGSSSDLLGAMTCAVNRLPPADSHLMLQQMIDVCSCPESEFHDAAAERIRELRERVQNPADFLGVLKAQIVLDACEHRDEIKSEYCILPEPIAYGDPPASLRNRICESLAQPKQVQDWPRYARVVGQLFQTPDGIDPAYVEILERRPQDFEAWLILLLSEPIGATLSADGQRLLARLIRCSSKGSTNLSPDDVLGFARLATRLDFLDEHASDLFEQEFIDREKNRDVILRHCADRATRRPIFEKVYAIARRTEDSNKFFSRLLIAQALNPDCEMLQLEGIARSVRVLRILEERGFISDTQFVELAKDIRENLPDSMEYLRQPRLGAGRETNLRSLYLALEEECQSYAELGVVGNIGLKRAAYSNLRRDVEELLDELER